MRPRKPRIALLLTLSLLPIVALQGVASAHIPEREGQVTPDEPFTWEGPTATGENQDYDADSGEPCGHEVENQCDTTLLNVAVDPSYWGAREGGLTVAIDNYFGVSGPASDFDLYIYESDAQANRGELIDSSGNPSAFPEEVFVPNASGYYLVQVVYWEVIESSYSGEAFIEERAAPPVFSVPNDFYFHDGGEPVYHGDQLITADPFYDTTKPTAALPDVGPDTSALINVGPGGIGDLAFTGRIEGTIESLTIRFWQKSPVSEALTGRATYDVSLFVGGTQLQLPPFSARSELTNVATEVSYVYGPENSGGIFPLSLDGRTPLTINIGSSFGEGDPAPVILYDSAQFPSGFSVNRDRGPIRGLPPDVDKPTGLQEFLASNPALGYTSRSEPHIAQSPVNPDILVASSKDYNRDPDALAEYEFKIGSYVSFDGGRSWADLGQTGVCPAGDAPPASWPNNTCYPEDDPNRDGLDPQDNPDNTKPCGIERGDYGEEYITSDGWVQFDDEGNAYLMVLDHPPFACDPEGNGWGMSFHRWESVSPEDVATGNTWGPRIVINSYPSTLERNTLGLLDDKNTFDVNNAGPDGDGNTGIMVACWGQTVDPLVKQQIVCERSTDGGRTWPDRPRPISDVEQLVIGVDVRGDSRDPNTFYATWLQYASGIVPGVPATLEFAVSRDGGVTWVHRQVPIAPVNDIPRQFPGQSFRNLSIPIMAVGPTAGELYITYAEYVRATDPSADEDEREADIKLVKSTNGGATWSAPITVNRTDERPNTNADQFQPYVAVTPSGQVNVAYFDRRLDVRKPPRTGNYFTDVWLARSNDGGVTFAERRLTHDSTDPEFNAPVSPSGLFFGDYQGLVVTDCVAIPFFNDTHLANDEYIDPGPVRDPEFDDGVPSSPYQEVITWRVPNIANWGGPGKLPPGCRT